MRLLEEVMQHLLVELLLENGAPVNHYEDDSRGTPLHFAAGLLTRFTPVQDYVAEFMSAPRSAVC